MFRQNEPVFGDLASKSGPWYLFSGPFFCSDLLERSGMVLVCTITMVVGAATLGGAGFQDYSKTICNYS